MDSLPKGAGTDCYLSPIRIALAIRQKIAEYTSPNDLERQSFANFIQKIDGSMMGVLKADSDDLSELKDFSKKQREVLALLREKLVRQIPIVSEKNFVKTILHHEIFCRETAGNGEKLVFVPDVDSKHFDGDVYKLYNRDIPFLGLPQKLVPKSSGSPLDLYIEHEKKHSPWLLGILLQMQEQAASGIFNPVEVSFLDRRAILLKEPFLSAITSEQFNFFIKKSMSVAESGTVFKGFNEMPVYRPNEGLFPTQDGKIVYVYDCEQKNCLHNKAEQESKMIDGFCLIADPKKHPELQPTLEFLEAHVPKECRVILNPKAMNSRNQARKDYEEARGNILQIFEDNVQGVPPTPLKPTRRANASNERGFLD